MENSSIQPIISVIVPIYKTPEEYLRNCILSIQNQSIRNIQIILVDDGSPDNCGMICDEYAREDSRIQVIHKKNGGVSSARNAGLEYVQGHYLAFVDSDDMILHDAWEKTIKQMSKNRADCAVFGWIDNTNNERKERVVADKLTKLTSIEAMRIIAGDNDACGGGYPWNKVWNVDTIRKLHQGIIPTFSTELFAYEDKLWILQMLNGMGDVLLLPDVCYDYCFVETSLTNNDSAWYRRQFNAYKAYDMICDYLSTVDQRAYRAGIGKYFRFSYIDMRNMYPWRKKDMAWFAETKQAVLKVCRRIRPGDLKSVKYNIAWLACFVLLSFSSIHSRKTQVRSQS